MLKKFLTLKYVILVFVLLMANFNSALAAYITPTRQEQELYNKLLTEFEQLDIDRKDVSEVISTFERPLVISFPCDATDLNKFVANVIKTKLAKFNDNSVHEDGIVLGGIYEWNCQVTSSGGKITIDCDNELKLNSNLMSAETGKDLRIKNTENLLILYHEFLHGQLMIDAMESSAKWKDDVCNKPPDGKVDYSYSDKEHKIINPLQKEFVSKIIDELGGMMIMEEILPEETNDGTFTKKLGNLYDYPEHIQSGLHLTLKGSNLINTQFSSPHSDIIFSGNLADKTKPGIAWIYIFGETKNSQPGNSSVIKIPSWIKQTAGWWSDGLITDHDFLKGIEYLIEKKIIYIQETTQKYSQEKIPSWIKQTAGWWSKGLIDDETFAKGIQYLISNGIIFVQ